ncbi:chitin-binding protein [Nonomuraea fuscirosea]|jgi:predicted carbohydrate-binding protein with CBM5 and CBM33 domain|uniref:Chitin-binding protein n=1 Tax=Nonomuraea fuscirosea TaxID=1291556 RepID=A0A2T0MRW0_9ACTN|nr:lytic polysaccharide monooxygenase [Nonomuraea fuscirosea]PRX61217.1 chitin-binding protein [Nonomuraea fuscirosea]WSA51262.1 lytic polysaccharide monooxygenase [Nonomuraea fuscirosea]
MKLFKSAALTAVLVLITSVLMAPTQAQAHGVSMFPGARTFLCWQDGLRDNGQILPYNPACAAAVNQSGTTPLYNWFAVLRSDGAGRTSGFIPDGQLCSGGTGGPYDFSAYNAVRSDWPLTHLTSGASITMRHSNWAEHPGAFNYYITKNGWNPNGPLKWSDLEPFGSVTNPPKSGGAGGLNYYYWNAQLPSGKSGRHIIYTHWIRSDSSENFYSCSDVVFDGGNGEVTGVGPGGSTPDPDPDPDPDPTDPPPTGGCTATWKATDTGWAGHFQGEVTVKNTGTSALNGWTVKWTYSGGQGFEGQPWNGVLSAQAPNVAVKNATHNAQLAPNASTTFGFNATGSVPSPAPSLTCTSP